MATFLAGNPTGPAIKSWVQQTIARCGAQREFPLWMLPEPLDLTPAGLRSRRAALLFLLALPGSVQVDVNLERELQGVQAPPPFDIDEVLQRASQHRSHLAGGWRSQPGKDVYWDDSYQERYGLRDVLLIAGSRSNWGAMTIANFGREACPVTDGLICVASDNPNGKADPTSDNNHLPAMTTIWLAAK